MHLNQSHIPLSNAMESLKKTDTTTTLRSSTNLVPDGQLIEKGHDVFVEEREPRFTRVVGNDAIIATQVARTDAFDLHLHFLHQCAPPTGSGNNAMHIKNFGHAWIV